MEENYNRCVWQRNEQSRIAIHKRALRHTNSGQEFSKTVAKVLKKPFWFPNVPAFALKLLMGEQAIIALEGSPISSKKTEATGFKYKYRNLKNALEDLLKK